MKLGDTWILVADASRGRILRQRQSGAALERVFENDFVGQRARDGERRGRTHDRGSGPHSIVPRGKAQRLAKAEFARELAATLDEATHASKLDHIVLVAPPLLLGEIRAHLSANTRHRVRAEFGKDLVRLNDREISKHLSKVLHFDPRVEA